MTAGIAAKRVFAYSEGQRHLERALELWDRVPDAEERAGMDKIDAAPPRRHRRRRSPARRRARSRSCARRSPRSTRQADPLRAAFLLERLGHYLRGAGETEAGFDAYDRAMALLPPGRQRPARAADRVPRARR